MFQSFIVGAFPAASVLGLAQAAAGGTAGDLPAAQAGVRTRSGLRAMAALRNLAIGALHLARRHDMTEATRWASRNMNRPSIILRLTS